jgi:hypothetical protein
MNDLQSIRRVVEAPIEQALSAMLPPIPVFTDNRLYDEDDATSEFCLVRLSFGLMSGPTIGICGDVEQIRASLVVEVFTPKGNGPGRGQDAATVVWQELAKLSRALGQPGTTFVRLGPISGPSFTPLQGRPHYFTRLSAPVHAQVLAPLLPTAFELVTDEGFGIITDQGARIIVFIA